MNNLLHGVLGLVHVKVAAVDHRQTREQEQKAPERLQHFEAADLTKAARKINISVEEEDAFLCQSNGRVGPPLLG